METIMRYINRISRCGVLYRNDKLEYMGLNGYQHVYIMRICQNPGISQEELARMIYINKSNVTRQLSLMEDSGFVVRKTDDNDRRSQKVFPTEKAYEAYPLVKDFISEWNAVLTQNLSADEISVLMEVLIKVSKNAEGGINRQ